MSINTTGFRGEIPRLSPQLLPDNCAQSAINVRLLDGNLVPIKGPTTAQTFTGGPYMTIFEMERISKWLRWEKIVDVAKSIIPGDVTDRIYFTTYGGTGVGLDRPRVTNGFYATDPSQRGSSQADAYPFKSFPMGSPNPLNPPVVRTAPPVGTTTDNDFAQQASVQSATINTAGTGYIVGDLVDILGGTLVTGMQGAQVKIIAVSGSVPTAISLVRSGFYTAGNAPGAASATAATSGSGTGLIVDCVGIAQNYTGLNAYTEDNAAGHYIHQSISANVLRIDTGQGDLAVLNTTQSFALSNASSYILQADVVTENNAGEYPDLVMFLAGTYNGSNAIVGPGVVLSKADGTLTLYSTFSGSNGGAVNGTNVNQQAFAPASDTVYRIRVASTANLSSTIPGFNVVATVALASDPGVILATVTGFVPYNGETLGVGTNHRFTHNNANGGTFQNLFISVTQKPDPANLEATEYVFTYLTVLGAESGPSPVSDLIDVVNNSTRAVTVALPAVPQANEQAQYGIAYDTDYAITLRRLYRTLTGPSGTTFNLVVELPIATTSYIDTIADADLGVELPSIGWELPPADGHSIINLPNGITAIASGNQLYLSAIGQAGAFVLTNRLPTDSPIVALGAIDTTIVVLTEGPVYIASGTDPSNYSMAKLESSYTCASHRSRAYLRQFGVVWASNEGLISSNGAGLRNITEQYYSKQDWDAFKRFWLYLNPASFVATTVDDRYIGFCQSTDGVFRGFIFDPKEAGHAWTWFNFWDDVGADLLLVTDETYEGCILLVDDEGYGGCILQAVEPPGDGFFATKTGDLFIIRGSNRDLFDSGDPLIYTWLSKVFRQSFPTTNILGRVKPSNGYDPMTTPVTVEYFADGVSIGVYTVQDRLPFTLNENCAEDISYQVVGNWPVEGVGFAERPEALT